MMSRVVLLLAAMSACAASIAAAQAQNDVTATDWARGQVARHLRPGVTWPEVQQAMHRAFSELDFDGKGINARSYELKRLTTEAQTRSAFLQQHLAHDLNNDGIVTRDEIVTSYHPRAAAQLQSPAGPIAPTPEQRRTVLDKLVANSMKSDLDGDGVLTFPEMREAAVKQVEQRSPGSGTVELVPAALDTDRDGAISFMEWDTALEAAFRAFDTDGNGQLSQDEISRAAQAAREARQKLEAAAMTQRRAAEQRARILSCEFPALPTGAKLTVIGAYEGKALSAVSIGGDDRSVTVSRLDIEPGTDPLYLILTSHSAKIWLITGAVDRVVQVTASTLQPGAENKPRVGVVGIDRKRVQIAAKANCLGYFSEQVSPEREAAMTALSEHFGRRPDLVGTSYGIATMRVPSMQLDEQEALPGKIALPSNGPAVAIWREMLRFNPAGLVSVAPEAVVASLPVARYTILPQQAGIAQLLEEGALKVAGSSNVFTLNGGQVSQSVMPSSFLIQRKIRMPAGLHGAHSVKFILGRGVPAPEGDPGHSCILAEETGKPIDGRSGC